MQNENDYLILQLQNECDELQEINDMNAATRADIIKMTKNLSRYKATRGQIYCNKSTTTTITSAAEAISNTPPPPVSNPDLNFHYHSQGLLG